LVKHIGLQMALKPQDNDAPPVLSLKNVDDDPALRPQRLADFQGQARVRALLGMELAGSASRGEQMDHVLLYGPPGLGKTTLARIIANEMASQFHFVSAPTIQRAADLAATLVVLQPGDVLFVDEIHRLSAAVEEVLYGAMEDFELNILAGDGSTPKPIRIQLSRFTLVAATTRPGMLTRPLRDRFGVDALLEPYHDADLASIVARSASLLGMTLQDGVPLEVACRARGTPRLANRLLKRLRNFAVTAGTDEVSLEVADNAFDFLGVDKRGLDNRDRRYLECLRERYQGKPVGLETLAAALNEDVDTLKDEVEPWLLFRGLVDRTQRGRILGPSFRDEHNHQGNLL
jgi:Holliday junction DNA helicase RuvB